jgi:hypothetical protein
LVQLTQRRTFFRQNQRYQGRQHWSAAALRFDRDMFSTPTSPWTGSASLTEPMKFFAKVAIS